MAESSQSDSNVASIILHQRDRYKRRVKELEEVDKHKFD